MPLTDDEAIATAMLHGADLARGHTGLWFLGLQGPFHPIEEDNHEATKEHGFKSCEELARAYCKFHNLEG